MITKGAQTGSNSLFERIQHTEDQGAENDTGMVIACLAFAFIVLILAIGYAWLHHSKKSRVEEENQPEDEAQDTGER